ncbi:IS110 family transposase [Escherichia coli]|uniref:IS110 family transposase n=1 Tax=Escherichia coli TaxID=562 RepID=UPI0012FF8638|nr:transposase [Escherichia coli]EEX2797555.1 transposase [Escherichia coli]
MSEQKITDIELAKTNFYLFSINAHGNPAGKTKLSRNQLLNWLVQQPKMTVAMEACGASHYWVREIRKLDHDVILLPAQHVKAYQRRQKNDYNDAQAIAEPCHAGSLDRCRC